MRPPRILIPVLFVCACGDSSSDSSAGFSSQPTDAGASSGATDGGPTPTTGAAMSTGMLSASDSTPTSSASASEASATDSGGDTSTGAASSTGAVGASTGATEAGESSTGPGCPAGQDGCPCAANDACDPGLVCVQGSCGPAAPVCGDGELDPGEACDDGNQINGDGCEANCTKTAMQALDNCGYESGDGVWFQIDYSNAFSVSNPDYTYSPTPGWGEAQWAPAGKDWPYAVDLFNNAKVVDDQIGTVALLDGTNKAVRVYFGLVGLNYTHATVCVEGRSYSVGSSVTFFVEEASSKQGEYGMMANDWTVHATGVDMQAYFIPGADFQAVQVQPSGGSGSLSLTRLRVTLHGASY